MNKKVQFRLDEILKERGLTIKGFARDAQLNYVTVIRICHNQNAGITLDIISRITSALNISPGELFKVESHKNKK
ncbi:MAG: helix-turn-helix transcriptional regulator [Chloracidobacterium sp.]|nr:helix-turn-helix transcriptional regulator [Chloracidobacterium sp.]